MSRTAGESRCRSWRIRSWRIVRCARPARHAATAKWHCADTSTGDSWYVKERER